MKKLGRATFLIVLVLILSLLVFVACDDKGASPNEPNVPNTPNVPNGDNSQSQQGGGDNQDNYTEGLVFKAHTALDGTVAVVGYDGFDKEVVIPSEYEGHAVTRIGEGAFQGIFGLKSVTIPDSILAISSQAFSGCTGLTSIAIPKNVTEIGMSAFEGCVGLTDITIPDKVKSIGDGAFYYCTGLTSVTIPNSVTFIGAYAFVNCDNLTSIRFNGTKEQWTAIKMRAVLREVMPSPCTIVCSDVTIEI